VTATPFSWLWTLLLCFCGFSVFVLFFYPQRIPAAYACKNFYLARIHQQDWVKGDCSDVLVTLSRMHSKLRGDQSAKETKSSAQAFVRTTTK
jgi:hypothetical protein